MITPYSNANYNTIPSRSIIRCPNGKLVIFYQSVSDNKLYIESSSDNGATWGGGIVLSGAATFYGYDIAVDNSNNLHVVFAYASGGTYYVVYRKLTYGGGTWSVGSAKNVYSTAGGLLKYPTVCCSNSGTDIYVGARLYTGVNYYVPIWHSSNGGSTFGSTEKNADYDANSIRYPLLVYKGSYPHLILYSNYGGTTALRHCYKSASGWSTVSNIDTNCNSLYFDATLKSNANLEVIYRTAAGIKHKEYITSWSAATTITADGSDTFPSIAAIDDNLYTFWIDNGSNDIFGKQYLSSTATWGSTIVVFDESEYGVVPTFTKVDKGISQSVSSFVSLLWGFFQAIPANFNILEHTSNVATSYTKDRHMARVTDGTLFWFFQNGNGIYYKASDDDGVTWSVAALVDASICYGFDVFAKGDEIHIAYEDFLSGNPQVKYRRLTYSAPFTLTIGTERTIYSYLGVNSTPTIVVDSNNRRWVAFRVLNGSNRFILEMHSDNETTWTGKTLTGNVAFNTLQPLYLLVGDKPFLIYKNLEEFYYRKFISGTTWTTATLIIDANEWSAGEINWSAASDGVNVFFSYYLGGGSTTRIGYKKWTPVGGWGAQTVIEDSNYCLNPVITYFNDQLWILYIYYTSSYKENIAYRKFHGTNWDSSRSYLVSDGLYNRYPTILEESGPYLHTAWAQGWEDQMLIENSNLLIAPESSAPSIIYPTGGEAIQTLTPNMDWLAGTDNQSAYRVIIYNQVTSAIVYDSGKVASTDTDMDIPAATLAWNITYQWKVKIWNEHDLDSDYSTPLALFKTSQAPTVTMTSPTCSGIIDESGPTITWTYFDNEGTPQAYYQFKVYENDGSTLVYDSDQVASDAAYHELPPGYLENYTDYYFEIRVWDGDNLIGTSLCLVTIGWDPPPTPIKSATAQPNSGNIKIDIENTIPVVDEWDVRSNIIYRRINGTAAWSSLGEIDIEECVLGNYEANLNTWLSTGVAVTLSGIDSFRDGEYGACVGTTAAGLAVYTRALSSVLDSSNISASGIVGIWAYIVDKSKLGWIRFAFGQDSSNYYYKTILATTFDDNAWNYLYEHLAHMNQVGTPNRTAIDWMRVTISGTIGLDYCDVILDAYRIWDPHLSYTDYLAGNRLLGCNSAVERNLYDYGVSAYNEDGLVESVKDENLAVSVTYPDTRNNWLVPIGDEANQIYFNIPRNATQDWKVRGMKEFYHPIGRRAPVERIMSEADYEQGTLTAIFDDCELGFEGVESIRDFIRYSPMLLKTYWGDVLYVALEEELDREYNDLTRKWYVTFSFREVTTE